MHRDIKLASAPPSPLRAVIIDFGAATFAPTSNDHMKGTIRYLAPEIMALKHGTTRPGTVYDKSADVWAAGVTAYEVLCGWRFRGEWVTRQVWEGMSRREHWRLPFTRDEQATEAFKAVDEMLAWEARERITARDALEYGVFREFDADTEPKVAEQTGSKRRGPSSENESNPNRPKISSKFKDKEK